MTDALAVGTVAQRAADVLEQVERVVVGKRPVLERILLAVLADGHVLIEDYPGLAKTMIARSLAAATGLRFGRVQFTPDLMPADVTGSSVLDQASATFAFRPGPVFCNLLLADEVNRSPPKTQAALLEAMEERQVTSDAGTRALEPPFLVIATQNPIEFEGTYPLPEAQLDRFLVRLAIGYPSADAELEMLVRHGTEWTPEPVLDRAGLLALQAVVARVHVGEAVARYMVALTAATRSAPGVDVGASPRGTLALLRLSRARAATEGRDFVVPDDVKAVAVAALAHRLVLEPEAWVRELRPESVVERCLGETPVPPATDDRE